MSEGKRLSGAELAEIAKRSDWYFAREKEDDERTADSFFNPDGYKAHLDRVALLSHIAALTAERGSVSEERVREFAEYPVTIWQVLMNGKITPTEMVCMPKALRDDAIAAIQQAMSECSGGGKAPPSQGKVERARELLSRAFSDAGGNEVFEEGSDTINKLHEIAITAITQALTEGSGQGTDGAEAMREAAAKIVVGWRECDWPEGFDRRTAELMAQDRAERIRALPLPVSADGAEIIAVATAIMRDALKGDLVVNQMTGFVKRYSTLPLPFSADGREAIIEPTDEMVMAAADFCSQCDSDECGWLGCARNQLRAALNLNPQQPSDTPEAFGVQPRSHRLSEGEK